MPTPGVHENAVRQAQERLSLGAERRIGVRLIHLYSNDVSKPVIRLETVREKVALAAETFRPAGVELEFAGFEEYAVTPALLTSESVTADVFNALGNQLGWTGTGAARSLRQWLIDYHTAIGQEQLIGWTSEFGNSGAFNFNPGSFFLHRTALGAGDILGFAHEVGHCFGLGHSFDVGLNCTSYKLVYGRAPAPTGNAFFESTSDCTSFVATYGAAALNWIDPRSNGTRSITPTTVTISLPDSTGVLQSYSAGDWRIDGFARKLASGPAVNVMTYWDAARYMSTTRGIVSADQIDFIRSALRQNDHRVGPGNRAILGRVPTESLLSQVDFDGDGRRDIASWEPPVLGCNGSACPTGSFKIFTSSSAFGLARTLSLGILDDTPLAGDFDGDGKADAAVFRRGLIREGQPETTVDTQPNAYFIFCSSRDNWDCSQRRVYGLGDTFRGGDFPVAGTTFLTTTATRELLVISPRTATGAQWRVFQLPAATTPLAFPFNNWGGWISKTPGYDFSLGTYDSHFMPDLWDGDGKTDAAVYNPRTAGLQLRRSEFAYSSVVTRDMGAEFIPTDTGSLSDRGGVVPVLQYRAYGSLTVPRRTFAMYDAANSTWVSKWVWWDTSSPQKCVFGSFADIPIGGLEYGDLYSEFATFQPYEDWRGYLSIKASSLSNCSGTVTQQVIPTFMNSYYTNNLQGVAVRDMYGDGRPELLMINQYSGAVTVFDSATSYASRGLVLKVGSVAHLL